MLIKIQRQTLVKSTLVLALLLKSFDLLALPALAKQSDTPNLQVDDLAALSSSSPLSVSPVPSTGQCSPLSLQGGPTGSAKVASLNPSNSLLAQSEAPGLPSGGSCPADFTSIPCGTGSELFCEVGGTPAENTGGGLLAPLAAAAGGGFPVAALAPLALSPLALLGGGGGGGGGTIAPTPDTPVEPIPEPSMIPAAALVFGFMIWNRRKRVGG